MTAAVLAGLGVGCALLGLAAGLRPTPRSAAQVLRALDGRSRVAGTGELSRRPDRVLGARLARLLEDDGLLPGTVRSTVRAAQSSLDVLCAEAVVGAAVGVVLPAVLAVLASVGGIGLPAAVPVSASIGMGSAGALLPFLAIRGAATRARRAARAVVAGFLDLVVLCLAGGMGIEGALHAASRIADHESSRRIAAALDLARDAGSTPWEALSSLGQELDVVELTELSAAVRLAGTEGARIRSTLSVKAAAIRRHELAQAEAEANTVTERLFLPGVFLLIGFLLFVGYPAVARITGAT